MPLLGESIKEVTNFNETNTHTHTHTHTDTNHKHILGKTNPDSHSAFETQYGSWGANARWKMDLLALVRA